MKKGLAAQQAVHKIKERDYENKRAAIDLKIKMEEQKQADLKSKLQRQREELALLAQAQKDAK